MNLLAFHFHTIPDLESGRRLFVKPADRDTLSDDDTAKVMMLQRQQVTGHDERMPALHLQKIVSFSVLLRYGERIKLWSIAAQAEVLERTLLEDFFDGVHLYQPRLLSWDGSRRDMPLLTYRSLLHGLALPRCWENTQAEHVDLQAVLGAGQAYPPSLAELAQTMGLPGELGRWDAFEVWESWMEGEHDAVLAAGEAHVLNVYLLFLRYQRLQGHLSTQDYKAACQQLREMLQEEGREQFLNAWAQA